MTFSSSRPEKTSLLTQPGNFATADAGEAYAAFAAKRQPEFTGQWAVSSRSEQK
jgi:hypothetical protein